MKQLRFFFAVLVSLFLALPTKAQYCTSSYGTGCGVGDQIQNFSTSGGISNITNNASGCSAGNYGDFTAQVHSAYPAQTVYLSVQAFLVYDQGFAIWIDWNDNDIFEPSEQVWNSGFASLSVFTGSFSIPYTATPGPRRMRLRANYASIPSDPCAFQQYGETEDYTFTVLPTPCVLPTLPTTFIINQLDRLHTITNVDIAGSGGNTAFVSPGETVSLEFDYSIGAGGAGCPGCVTQSYVGIFNQWSVCYRSYGGYCNCSGTESFTFTAPTTPGIYYITHGATWLFSCDPIPTRPQNNTNGLAAIIVRESYSSSITNVSCGGASDGEILITPDHATTNNSYLWDFGSNSNFAAGLTNTDYSVISTDAFGCYQFDTLTVGIDDVTPPTVFTQNLERYLDASGIATVLPAEIDSGSADACGIASYLLSQDTFTCYDIGDNTVSLIVTDVSGNTATASATVTIIDTHSNSVCDKAGAGYALDFDGTNDFVALPGIVSTVVNNFTLEGWVYPESIGGTQVLIYNGNTSTSGWGMILSTTGQLQLLYGGISLSFSGYTLPENKWTHVALVRNAGNAVLYANGIAVSGTIANTPAVPTNGTFIGSNEAGLENFNGKIDEVRIWNTPLTPALLRDYMCKKITPSHPQYAALTAYFRFDENEGTTAHDYTENNNDATINNGAEWVLSGAPLGDESAYLYSASPTVSLASDAGDSLTINNFTGSPSGAHVYLVDRAPLNNEISSEAINQLFDDHYYGVYTVEGSSPDYTAILSYGGNTNINASSDQIRAISRTDGADTIWDKTRGALYANEANQTMVLPKQIRSEFLFATEAYTQKAGSGYALSFDGVNDVVLIPDHPSFQVDKFSIEAWAKSDNSSSATVYIAGKAFEELELHLLPSNVLRFIPTTGVYYDSPANSFVQGEWTHFAASYDPANSEARLYINGKEVPGTNAGFNPLSTAISTSTANYHIGNRATMLYPFLGEIDEVRLWNTVIDSVHIKTWMCRKLNLSADSIESLIAYYRFDEAQGNNLIDLANGRDGVLTNMDTINDWEVSGAAIGDTSVFSYFTSPDLSIILADGDSVIVNDFSDIPTGTHLYAVNEAPVLNTTPAGYSALESTRYFGVFSFGGTDPSYSVRYAYGSNLGIAASVDEARAGLLNRMGSDDTEWSGVDFFTDSVNQNIYNCSDTNTREFIIGFTDTNVAHSRAIANDTVVYLDASGNAVIDTTWINNGSYDYCSLDSLWINADSFDCTNTGVNQVVLFMTNALGMTFTDTADVTVLDTIFPTILAQNLTVGLDATGNASISSDSVDIGSFDNCGIASISLSDSIFDCDDVGTFQIAITVIDFSNNISVDSVTITVLDTIAPIVLAQSDTFYLSATGEFTLTTGMIDNGSSDACGVSLSIDTSFFNCIAHNNTFLVVLTGVDSSANTDTAHAQVTILDNIIPTVIAQDITVYLDASGTVSISTLDIDNGSFDNCSIDTLMLSTYDFDCSDIGPNTVTLTANDVNGLTNSVNATVTVVDTTSPTALANDTTIYLDVFGNGSITALGIDDGSFDNCNIVSYSISDSIFDCSNAGSTVVVILTVIDQSGNLDTVSSNVTILDTIAPVVTAANGTFYLDSTGNFTLDVSDINNASSDACGISLSIDTASFDCDGHGTTFAVILTGTDPSFNSASDTAFVTILDTISPVVYTQDIVVSLDSFGFIVVSPNSVDSGSWDSCGIASYSLDIDTFGCADVGVNAVVLTVTDTKGNAASAAATITIVDDIAPEVITQNITVTLDAFGNASITPAMIDNGSWDSCGIASYSLDTSAFSCPDTGLITVTLTVVDINGNTSSNTAVVTLIDTIAPTVITQNVTIYLDAFGVASISTAMINNGSTDNCDIDTLVLDQTSFTCADTTSQIVTLTATDISGNTASTTATVSILDTVAPIVITQNITRYLDANGEVTITPAEINNGSTDNCDIDSIWLSETAFFCADTAAPNTVSLFVKDVSGNINSAQAQVTIFDTIAPTVTAQNLVIYLDSFGFAEIFPSQVDSNSLDNCGIDSSWISQNIYDCGFAGDTSTVLLFMRDISGNISSDSALVITIDSIAPEVITQDLTIYLDSFGSASITPTMVDNGSWDSCGIDNLSLNQSIFNCSNIGTNTVTLSVTDVHGNTSSNTATITVLDTIAPTIQIIDTFFVWLDSNGLATVTADSIDLGTWDSCSTPVISIDTFSFTCANHQDTLAVVFTAVDDYGNTSTDTSIFIINDTIAPSIFAHNDTFYLDSNGMFLLTPSMLDDSTMDACGVDTLYLSDTLLTCSIVDSTIEVWFFASDIFGNIDSVLLNITTLDTIHPELTCLANIIAPNDSGDCGAIVSFNWPTAWDNCSIDSIVQIDTTGLDSASFFPVGITELSYVAYDQSGNTDTCSFTIEVQDVQFPELFCQADTLICDTTYIFTYPTYADNCTGFEVIQIAGIESGAFYPVGSTINQFVVTDSYGNSDTCSYEVFRFDYPSVADAGLDQELCEDFVTTMDGNQPAVGDGIWRIITGIGTVADSLNRTSEVSGFTSGITQLEWRIENGVCPIERDTMTIIEYINPAAANAGSAQILCDTFETQLGAIADDIGTGNWLVPSNGATIEDTSDPFTLVEDLAIGSYSFIWRVVNGVCPITFDTITVDVTPYPEVDAGPDKFVFFPTSIEIGATSNLPVTFSWSPSYALEEEIGEIVLATPQETTMYVVVAETEFGCRTSDTMSVHVNVGPVLPTAFTPDGDNYNDVWNLKELESYPDCVVKVYNRWGYLMFESNGYVESWDGTYKGEPLPSGSYFYVIELNVEEVPPQTGSVTIIK